MRRRSILAAAAAAAPALAGCNRGAVPAPPPLYVGRAPIPLDAGTLEVEDRRRALPEANFIDERRTREFGQEVERYLRARFRAGGGAAGAAVLGIEQASVVERLVPGRTGGVIGLVGNEPTFELAGTLGVRVALRDAAGADRGYAATSVARTRSVGAKRSAVERDREARLLMVDLLNQLDPALEAAVSQNLGAGAAAGPASGGVGAGGVF